MKFGLSQKIGLITGIVMVATSAIAFYGFHMPYQSKFPIVLYSIYTSGILLALILFHKQSAAVKFKDYFSEGFKTFIIAVLLIVIYTFVFVKTNPHMIDGFIEENNKQLAAQGNRTAAEIAANANSIRSMFLLTMVTGTMVIYLIIGALVSVIAAGFLSQQKNNPV